MFPLENQTGIPKGFRQIPSESDGNSVRILGPDFQKILDLDFNCSVGVRSFHFNHEERERELGKERDGARKREKEGDFHGFGWPVTRKNSCHHL